uniref:Uncharacterized protein n=1 Tax=viral metagenome TaxID=1070528 RepID=A0A6C0KSI5_9ZZZZ
MSNELNLQEHYARKKSIVAITGKAILFASMQFAIGSVEMSSKFSVKNFSKDQTTLQHAADALSDYIFIGVVWTLGTCMMFWGNYGMKGAIINFIANFIIMAWIMTSYKGAFEYACVTGNLEYPELFRKRKNVHLGLNQASTAAANQ